MHQIDGWIRDLFADYTSKTIRHGRFVMQQERSRPE
jgi:hypothetical protein